MSKLGTEKIEQETSDKFFCLFKKSSKDLSLKSD